MNKVYLLDTNIVSEFTKDNPNQKVLALYTARKNMCAISAVTWQELVFGLSKIPSTTAFTNCWFTLRCTDETAVSVIFTATAFFLSLT